MTRVALIGAGPLPSAEHRTLGFPQLRTQHFHDLLAPHHDLSTVLLQKTPLASSTVPKVTCIDPTSADWITAARRACASADVLVSAGPFLPGQLACLIADDRPVWADLPGDPFSEWQAVVRAPDSGHDDRRRNAAHAAAMTVLSRADRISVISESQRLAVQGQLGVVGRLADCPDDLATVIAIRHNLPMTKLTPRPRRASDELIVALCGGFNTWFDDESLVKVLDAAMHRAPNLSVVVTGGGITGHYTAGYERFVSWHQRSAMSDRITLHGWVPHDALPVVLGNTHIGMYLDRPGSEALLGSRTRVHLFTWLGMATLGTPGSDLTRAMARNGLMHAVTGNNAVETLVSLSRSPMDGATASSAQQWMHDQFSAQPGTDALQRWVDHPRRTPSAPAIDILLQENTRLLQALDDVHRSWTWQTLSPVHRLLQRLRGTRQD